MAKVYNKTKGFGSISRDCVFDNELSDRARFLYVYMACKPEGWEFYQDKVAEELGYKKDTLRKYLDELITRGWITELEQHNDGKFGCLEYIIEIEKRDGNLPIRKKPDTEKTRIGKNHNHINIDNKEIENNISTINSPYKERDNINKLSDDNSKEGGTPDTDMLFLEFWDLYNKKVGKKDTYKLWCKLSKADKQKAIDAIEPYKESRRHEMRYIKDPVRYIRHKTWEDDFASVNRKTFYDVLPTDTEKQKNFKVWMRTYYPNVEKVNTPLNCEDCQRLMEKYDVDMVKEQLAYINENYVRFIHKDLAGEIDYYLKKKWEDAV